ncbi:MAG: 2-hydroxychromene-2-carboxylate isomerase [Hyphomonas sp.]|jgi:2-hydroxychromene-2-carboxylate isomerase|nr:2-hydroxychromene-2-carboxylate isomerase [Henriciella sp.]MBO6694906.1 2-hydroxychromene-2-carboxylate isomerase [Henriciella sp.]MCR9224753.1 2-hydroxychromene-2-carboxylate isomerase [Hyphomonas sp.]
MAKTLEFFFDYMSPTSFLGWAVVPGVIERTGAELKIKPMFLGGVMKATGNQPPGMVPAKGKYMQQDMARCCARHGIQIFSNKHFPMMNTRPLTGATIRLADDQEQQIKLLNAGFKHVWGRKDGGVNTGDEAEFKEAFGSEGFDADQLWALGNDPETKAMLRANTEEAIARGAFGAPTFFVGDEMFFGHDRLDYAEEALTA